MLPRRPHLGVVTSVKRNAGPPSSYTAPVRELVPYVESDSAHTSVVRNPQMELHVRSSSVKVLRQREDYELGRPLPVFGDHDKVAGTVVLDVGFSPVPGRLTISMEGVFTYLSPHLKHSMLSTIASSQQHSLYLTSVVIPVGGLTSQRSLSSLREALTATVRPIRRERRPSLSDIKGAPRPFPFSFDLPRATRLGEEMPPTFSSISLGEAGPRARACVERVEISYKISATWEPTGPGESVSLEMPILFYPEHDFQSLDGTALEPTSWFEVPLCSDRTIPFTCAVTLPDPAVFSRAASIPYFVVFTTKPRSPTLAREITMDATIALSLVREIKIDSIPVPPPLSPSSSSASASSASSSSFDIPPPLPSRPLFKRMVNSAPPVLMRPASHRGRGRKRSLPPEADKALPALPVEGMFESRTLCTDVCVGFPKRPRTRIEPHQRHPSLEAHSALPDGLYRGKMQLDRQMLPSVAWSGLTVKYFLQVSVLFGQDELRARVPIRLF